MPRQEDNEMAERYWHFCQVDEHGVARLGYGDNREVKAGETLRVEGEPVLCERGLHASRRLWDALSYAQGKRLALCRVELGGTVQHGDNESVGNSRTVVAMLDADTTETLLRDFGRWCALQVAHLWNAPDVVRQYLETGDELLRDAAWAASRAADLEASRDAAWFAARAAARAADWTVKMEEYAAELERRGLALVSAGEQSWTPRN